MRSNSNETIFFRVRNAVADACRWRYQINCHLAVAPFNSTITCPEHAKTPGSTSDCCDVVPGDKTLDDVFSGLHYATGARLRPCKLHVTGKTDINLARTGTNRGHYRSPAVIYISSRSQHVQIKAVRDTHPIATPCRLRQLRRKCGLTFGSVHVFTKQKQRT